MLVILLGNYCISGVEFVLVDSNYKTISPMDVATFEIKLINNADRNTDVALTIESIPEGWSAYIENNVSVLKKSEKTFF